MIRAAIVRAGGFLDFARYMELALYAPGLGYYSAGSVKFGPAGDFVTAPEISSDLRARTRGHAWRRARRRRRACRARARGRQRCARCGVARRVDVGGARCRLLDSRAERRSTGSTAADARAVRAARALARSAAPDTVQRCDRRQRSARRVAGIVFRESGRRGARPRRRERRCKVSSGRSAATHRSSRRQSRDSSAHSPRRSRTAIAPSFVSRCRHGSALWPRASNAARCCSWTTVSYAQSTTTSNGRAARSCAITDIARTPIHFYTPACRTSRRGSTSVPWSTPRHAAGLTLAGFTTQGQYLTSLLAAAPGGFGVDAASPREQSALKTLILPGEMGERFKVLLLRKGAAGPPLPGRDFRARLA